MTTNEKIEQLRTLMTRHGVDMYIIQCNDPHQSEYAPDHWRDRAWMSGFTGSVGTLVVTMTRSGLWVDGRYHIQGAKEIEGSEIMLFKQGLEGVVTYDVWVAQTIESGQTIGFYGESFPYGSQEKIRGHLAEKHVEFFVEEDLVGHLWTDRPSKVFGAILEHGPGYSGQSIEERLTLVRQGMVEKKAQVFMVSTCDDLAWLFHMRGQDVPNNPFVTSYGLISHDQAYLYLEMDCLTDHHKATFIKNGVTLKPYQAIFDDLHGMTEDKAVYVQGSKTSVKVMAALAPSARCIDGLNLTTPLKAIKTKVEVDHLLRCHEKDGLAMVAFLHWLDKAMVQEEITEISASDKLEAFRRAQEGFRQLSFDTIAAYKDHGAMMHYKANAQGQYTLERAGLFLVDSGGQYLDGTTDITRTMALGPLTDQEKSDFTLTLKGLIALSKTQFLYGATGSNLDVIARHALWQEGLDYKCGTGHGVGFFLGVHEGPQNFSQQQNTVRLEAGMVITIEPGVYRAKGHGVRLENIVLVQEACTTDFGKFMKFKTLTLCPIDLRAIEKDLLSAEEVEWLNAYHEKVYDTLAPKLDDDHKAWLKAKTQAI